MPVAAALIYMGFFVSIYLVIYYLLAHCYLQTERYRQIWLVIMVYLILGAVGLTAMGLDILDQSLSLYGIPILMLALGIHLYSISGQKVGSSVFSGADRG